MEKIIAHQLPQIVHQTADSDFLMAGECDAPAHINCIAFKIRKFVT